MKCERCKKKIKGDFAYIILTPSGRMIVCEKCSSEMNEEYPRGPIPNCGDT